MPRLFQDEKDTRRIVQAIREIQALPPAASGDLAAHLADATDAHDASAISFSPAGSIAATDVQAAIEELDGDVEGLREVLTANRTYYIRTDGNDSNTGLADNAGGAWLTGQHAFEVICGTLDIAAFVITLQFRDGSFPTIDVGSVAASRSFVGGGVVQIQGNNADVTAVSIDGLLLGGFGVGLNTDTFIYVSDVTLEASASPCFMVAGNCTALISTATGASGSGAGRIKIGAPGASFYNAIYVQTGAKLFNYAIEQTIETGDCAGFIAVGQNSYAQMYPSDTVIVGAPDYSGGFVQVSTSSVVDIYLSVSSGTATGRRFRAFNNSVINNGAGVTHLPGDAPGVLSSGGVYDQSHQVGSAFELDTAATEGFVHVPSCDGPPTGTPDLSTIGVPIVVDTQNNKLYFYSSGAWRDAGP